MVIKTSSENAEAWYYKGLILYELNNIKEAEEAFKCSLQAFDDYIKFNPEDSTSWYQRGRILYSLKSYNDALKSFQKAIDINGGDAGFWNDKGFI
jgi:tetratricopeptide (TPR) repeat protein